MTRDRVLDALREAGSEYVSGEALARSLGLSRTAVWKAIDQLRREGYRIESGPNRGYRLGADNDVLSLEGLSRYLREPRIRPQVYESIGSTNTALKSMAAEGAPEGLALIAGAQSQGRGRLGRSFYSPAGSGLYLSLLLRPDCDPGKATQLTACAAVAVAEALEELSGKSVGIKWVNDLLMDGRKVCGILSEASLDCESGTVNYVIVGVGINVRRPEGGFPEELRDIAGAAFGDESIPDLRCRLAASVLDRLWQAYEHREDGGVLEAYRKRSLVLGRPINILPREGEPERATALEIEPDFALRVRLEDGTIRRLNSGEVSIRI